MGLFLARADRLEIAVGIHELGAGRRLPLGGYTERRDKMADSGGKPLEARAFVFRQGDLKLALVSVELLTVPRSFYLDVKRLLPGYEVLVCASHTHCAPDSQMLNSNMTMKIPGIAAFDKEVAAAFARDVAEAVRAAKSFRVVQWIRWNESHVELNRTRRGDGSSRPRFVRLQISDGTRLYTVGQFSAHPTVLGPEWNKTDGDWPGAWMRLAPAGETRMFLNGAMGDVSPVPPNGASGMKGVEAMASALEKAKTEFSESVASPQISLEESPIDLPPVRPHPDFAKLNGIPSALANLLVSKFAETEGSVQVLKFSNRFALVFVPAEPTDALGAAIEAQVAGRSATVSFCNGWLGYELTRSQYRNGGYEASLSFHGEEIADRIVDAAKRADHTLAFEKISRPAAFQSSRNRFRPASESGW